MRESKLIKSLLENEDGELPLQRPSKPRLTLDKLEVGTAPTDYLTKPNLLPLGKSLFGEYFGVELELEVDGAASFTDEAYKLRNRAVYLANSILNSNKDVKFCVIKNDGSLQNGFEICTRPASMEFHRNAWTDFFDTLPEKVVAKESCGMHVHISKKALSSLQMGKILVFIHSKNNSNFVSLIAGRKSNHYSNFNTDRKFGHALPKYLNTNTYTHYSAVNLLNPDTVELRIFKSTTDKARFFTNIEFCHALVKFTFPGHSSFVDMNTHIPFCDFVTNNRKHYPYLTNFLSDLKLIHKDFVIKDTTQYRPLL